MTIMDDTNEHLHNPSLLHGSTGKHEVSYPAEEENYMKVANQKGLKRADPKSLRSRKGSYR